MYGIGISLRPLEGLTLTMDVNRVEYSEMTDDVAGPPEYASENGSFTVENGTELRFGVEYAFSNLRTPIYVRGGLWLDPAHQMGYRGSINDPIFLALWEAERETEDEGHLTAGVGWLIANRLTIDLGFDMSDRLDTVSAAAGYRF
jgi:long-subunit fatty acid transport protein